MAPLMLHCYFIIQGRMFVIRVSNFWVSIFKSVDACRLHGHRSGDERDVHRLHDPGHRDGPISARPGSPAELHRHRGES